ncbi:NAD(P)H-binding protein [Granulicoccus sp. GXG6511]|uniref:NAD(P)H-binding protein n=1 Tax=Granulicoccus sp. GXG6511 TaxID=3381351 RepID=UPI003D7F10A0
MRIVIIGGHGRVARLLAPLLVNAGHEVEALVRSADHIDEVEAAGAAARLADLERHDTAGLVELLRGRDAVVWCVGPAIDDPERNKSVDRDAAIRSIDAAAAAGIGRYVMVSHSRTGRVPGGPGDPDGPYAEALAAADAHLRSSTLNWTILGPGVLTDNPGTGMLEVGDHVTCGDTSRANVARVIRQVVCSTDLGGVTLNFRDGHMPIAEALQVATMVSSG